MKLKAFGATEQRIYNAVKPIADEFGFQIWDVRFEKEGACWYLRIFIDQESGITIEDCEKMTEPVNKLLDEHFLMRLFGVFRFINTHQLYF